MKFILLNGILVGIVPVVGISLEDTIAVVGIALEGTTAEVDTNLKEGIALMDTTTEGTVVASTITMGNLKEGILVDRLKVQQSLLVTANIRARPIRNLG